MTTSFKEVTGERDMIGIIVKWIFILFNVFMFLCAINTHYPFFPKKEPDTSTVEGFQLTIDLTLGIGSIIFRDEELMLGLAHNSIHFYDNIVAPYKGMLEQWYVRKKGTKIYCYLIFLTIVCVMNPSSSLAWKLFSDLPKPPNELINYFDI